MPSDRLLWQCRRGMLELDVLLHTFLRDRYERLSASERQAFARLLEQEDADLCDWVVGLSTPPTELRAVVDALRACRVYAQRSVPSVQTGPTEGDEPVAVSTQSLLAKVP